MGSLNVKCFYCGHVIERQAYAYQRVVGWERMSRDGKGGTNHVRCREPLGEYACEACVDLEAKGIGVRQMPLLGNR